MTESHAAIEIGKKAPAFSLKNQDGKTVKLAELGGRWVVLYFYPKDDTPGCTTEACDFTAGLAAFEGLEAIVLGCSPDSPESHQKFIKKRALTIGLLSDPDHAVLEKYGAWGEKNLYGKKSLGVLRSTVLIDPAGKVAHHWTKVKAAGHAEAVRAKLAELRGERAALLC
jgi:peroxiredoxin Q/BCP